MVVVIVHEQKSRWRICGKRWWDSRAARIYFNDEIRSRAHLIDRVGCIRNAGRITKRGHRNNFAASRKADHADTVGINAPFTGAAAHQPHRTQAVLVWM